MARAFQISMVNNHRTFLKIVSNNCVPGLSFTFIDFTNLNIKGCCLDLRNPCPCISIHLQSLLADQFFSHAFKMLGKCKLITLSYFFLLPSFLPRLCKCPEGYGPITKLYDCFDRDRCLHLPGDWMNVEKFMVDFPLRRLRA